MWADAGIVLATLGGIWVLQTAGRFCRRLWCAARGDDTPLVWWG